MSLYQSVDVMVANGLLDGFTKSDTEILSMPLIKYVYKLTIVPTGHFYIGQTSNLKTRFHHHIVSIADYEYGKAVQPFHKIIGPLLNEMYQSLDAGRKKKPTFDIFIRKQMTAYIYAITGDQPSADLVEYHYINKFKNDPLCLNIN